MSKATNFLAMTMGFAATLGGPYINQDFFKEKVLPSVRHRETCPRCGSTLVNLYWRGNEWRCLRCWEKSEEEARE